MSGEADPAVHDRPDGDVAGFDGLAAELKALFGQAGSGSLEDETFSRMALRVFAFQFHHCRPYRAFCRSRGLSPDSVRDWTEVPPVPTAAFKHLTLLSGDRSQVGVRFRTSGTTAGAARRGVHHVRDVGLYAASLLPSFGRHLLPEGHRIPILSLVPDAGSRPDSSLSHMLSIVTEECGAPGSRAYVDTGGGLDLDGFTAACRSAETAGAPVLVAGTAFSFVHLLDALEAHGTRFHLPSRSRILETGGFKGRSRELSRDELYGSLHRALGIPPAWIVNEYGMTELLSQFYDGVAGSAGSGERIHIPPPWMRSRALDPVTLEDLGEGQAGLLCHYDLANLGSVSAVLTEDMGLLEGAGIRLLGRAAGAEPRGCSIAMDDLLAAARRSGS